jgi:hypothetical protein
VAWLVKPSVPFSAANQAPFAIPVMPIFSVKLTTGELLSFDNPHAFRPVAPRQASRFNDRSAAIGAAFQSGLTAKQFVLVPAPAETESSEESARGISAPLVLKLSVAP